MSLLESIVFGALLALVVVGGGAVLIAVCLDPVPKEK